MGPEIKEVEKEGVWQAQSSELEVRGTASPPRSEKISNHSTRLVCGDRLEVK